jgi:hypothetical protein
LEQVIVLIAGSAEGIDLAVDPDPADTALPVAALLAAGANKGSS